MAIKNNGDSKQQRQSFVTRILQYNAREQTLEFPSTHGCWGNNTLPPSPPLRGQPVETRAFILILGCCCLIR